MDVDGLIEQASLVLSAHDGSSRGFAQPLADLLLLRHDSPSAFEATVYEPVLCLILQGRKEVEIGDQMLSFGAGECLLVSHDLPVRSRIVDAPYLALVLDIDLPTIRRLYEEVADAQLDIGFASAAQTHHAGPELLDALRRYLSLAASPAEARVLGPLVAREIHYRLLVAPFGGMLRSLLLHDSHASAVARAIGRIRDDIRAPLAVPELARWVGMSASSFHKHFKEVTSTTPLQYQKELRLLEARRLLRSGRASVTAAAYEVGYESPSQFSREYSRKFGVAPSQDA